MKQAIFTESLTIAISPEQHAKIKEITDYRRISMGEWVRDAIDTALKNWPTQEEQTNGR
jgi:hypothetical protein